MISARPNLIDRMVAAVSPQRGVARLAARARLSAATAMTAPTSPGGALAGRGGYKGAHGDRRATRGWFARSRSANQDALGDQKALIARARDAAMNMPLATAAIERPITFSIGTGLMAIPDLDANALGIGEDEALALASTIAADFDNYMASTDPDAERRSTGYGQQALVMRGALESGDIAGLRVMPEGQRGRLAHTAWKLVEADRIVSPANHQEGKRLANAAGVETGNFCAGGVEVDAYSAPIAYHILRSAPASFGGATNAGRTASDTVRIEAWGEKSKLPTVLHVMLQRRPEQYRGVSILAPVLEALKQVSTLTEAELFAAVLQGMIAIVNKSPGAGQMPEPVYAPDNALVTHSNPDATAAAAAGAPEYHLEPGMVMEIDTEDSVELKSPGRPNPAFDPFFMAMSKQIAAALEIPIEVLLLAFTASYSASRGALEVFYIKVRQWREWLASHWCAPVYRAWLFEQVASGRYRMAGFLTDERVRERWSNVRFRGDGKLTLDPAREAKALEVHEAHGWTTAAEITAELNGGDFEANLLRRAGEHRRFVAAGLPIPNAKGGGSAPAAEHETGDREKREDEE